MNTSNNGTRRKITVGVIVVCAVLGIGYWRFGGAKSKPVTSSDIAVERGDIEVKVMAQGKIASTQRALVTAPYAGYITDIFVKVGQNVKQGDPIVTVTSLYMKVLFPCVPRLKEPLSKFRNVAVLT